MSILTVEESPPLALTGPQNPTPWEAQQAARLEREAYDANTLGKVALVLGGAFLLYRGFAARRVKESLPVSPEASTLRMLFRAAWNVFQPQWINITAPAVANAYAIGMIDARAGRVPPELLQLFAEQYARDIGSYFNDTSIEALTEGFQTYVNKKLPKKMAAEKVLAAYGLNVKQMRAVVAAEQLGAMKITSPVELHTERKVERYIETQLLRRAQDMGDNEAWTATRRGKQMAWMYLFNSDQLPGDAKKVWLTAHDEKVCKYCGPMNGRRAALMEPFETDIGAVWVPSLHPNCRCDIYLDVPTHELFGKADWWREIEHPRDPEGQFTFKPKKTLVQTLEEEREETEAPPTVRPLGAPGTTGVQQLGGWEPSAPVTALGAPAASASVVQPLSAPVRQLTETPEALAALQEAVAQAERIEATRIAERQMVEQAVTQVVGVPPKVKTTTGNVYYFFEREPSLHRDISHPVSEGDRVQFYEDSVFVNKNDYADRMVQDTKDLVEALTQAAGPADYYFNPDAFRRGALDVLQGRRQTEEAMYARNMFGVSRDAEIRNIYVMPVDTAPYEDQPPDNFTMPGTFIVTRIVDLETMPFQIVELDFED